MKEILGCITDFLECMAIPIVIMLACFGFMTLLNLDEFPDKIYYYENEVQINAIKYHDEIYLKKGE